MLGYVGVDDNGLGGLEQKFDEQLHGIPGRNVTAMDARRQVLGSSEHEPEPGRNMMLTIDEKIQYMAEQALDHTMERTQALNGTVVVQDSHTGQILALAIRPILQSKRFSPHNAGRLRDHAVSDVYEPGSTFKLVTYATALDQKVATPDDMIDCQGGQITLAGRVIHDDKSDRGLGVVSVATALARSSDVAAVKLALKIGPDHFYDYIRAFGFGSRSGIELPGETRGLLQPVKRWGSSSIGSIAIGQEVAVTPLQLVTMVSTIANGGVYLPPHILFPGQVESPTQKPLTAQPFKAGEELPNPLPGGSHRVISTMAAAQMRKMMEGVVLFGTGKSAQLNGYSSGGKTGTAQKIDPATHRYSKSMHIASFAGFAPVNNPVISVAVVIDTPKGDYYGSSVSAPVFAEVAQQVLEYLGVPHDVDSEACNQRQGCKARHGRRLQCGRARHSGTLHAANDLPSDDPLRGGPQPAPVAANPAKPATTIAPAPPQTASESKSPTPEPPLALQQTPRTVTIVDPNNIRVPSLMGLPIRKAIEQAAAAGLEVQIVGNGTCRQQAPGPGAMVAPNTKIVVRCGH